jgi:ribosomal protein S15P/S13E
MLDKDYYYLDEAAQILTEKTGFKITQDDLIHKAIEYKLFLHISASQWLVTFENKPPFRFDGYCGIEASDLKAALQAYKRRTPFYASNIPVKTSELAKFGILSDLDYSFLLPAVECSCPLDFADLVVSQDALLDFIDFQYPEIKDKNLNTVQPVATNETDIPNLFRRNQTGTWEFRFQNTDYPAIPSRRGFLFLQQLLQNPNKHISTTQLNAIFSGNHSDPVQSHDEAYLNENLSISTDSDAGEFFDEKAKNEYQARIKILQELIDDAIELNDIEKAEGYKAELDTLTKEISKGMDHKKRIKKDKSNERKIADSVTRNIKNSLTVIEEKCPELGKYLKQTIKTGKQCIYTDTSITWIFE